MAELLTLDDLAARLHVAPRWLSRRLARLCAAGFPRPLPPLRPQLRWDPQALEDWLAGFRAGTPAAATTVPANDADPDPVSRRLAARGARIVLGEQR